VSRERILSSGIPVLVLALLPLLLTSNKNMTLATTAVVYAIVASGLAVMYGQLGVLAMSHAGVWGVGAFIGTILMTDHGWSFWTALAAAAVGAAIAGGVTALPAFRLRGHYLLIVGFIVTQLLVVIGNQVKFTGGPEGLLVDTKPGSLLGIDLTHARGFYYVCAVFLVLALALSAWIAARPLGRRFVAVRENALLGESLGIDRRRTILVGFVLSGIFAGIGGVLYAVNLGQIEPDLFGLNAAVLLPLIIMIGGARQLWGPVVGAFVVVFLPEVLGLAPTDQQAVNGALLIVIILAMPDGILGALRRLIATVRERRADGADPSAAATVERGAA
jgi:branched-chain amino acid transport system permease protein